MQPSKPPPRQPFWPLAAEHLGGAAVSDASMSKRRHLEEELPELLEFSQSFGK